MKKIRKLFVAAVVLLTLAGGLIFLPDLFCMQKGNTDTLTYAKLQNVWASEANYDANDAEFCEKYGRGLLQEEPDEQYLYKPNTGISSYSLPTALPNAVDISATKYFPTIQSQGSLGSCTAWSSTYYQYTYEVARLKDWEVKSPNGTNNTSRVFSPKFTYNLGNGGSDSGLGYSTAYTILGTQGSATWAEFPYVGSAGTNGINYLEWPTNAAVYKNALNTKLSKQAYVYVNTAVSGTNLSSSINSMKTWLSEGRAIWVSSYWNLKTTTVPGYGAVATHDVTGSSGHAVTVVGYDDNLTVTTAAGETLKGAFKIANSWGSTWGNSGYIWVMYDALYSVSTAAPSLNVSGRIGVFCFNNVAYYIEVQDYTPVNMTAEVTLNTANRSQVRVNLAKNSVSNPNTYSTVSTFLSASRGGAYGFTGTALASEATFAFSFNATSSEIAQNLTWRVSVQNASGASPVTVKQIKFYNGQTLMYDITPNESINTVSTVQYNYSNTAIAITNVAIGVTAPVAGETPSSDSTGSGNFTRGNVTWSENPATFAGSTQYTASIMLTANSGYTFTGLTTATINGYNATVTNNTGNTVTLSYKFAATAPISIKTAAVTITAPVTGSVPDTAADGSGNFICGNVTWSGSPAIFAGSTQYTASITLTANSGYTFAGLETATINEYNATVTNNTENTIALHYNFAATDAATVNSISVKTQPVKLAYNIGEALKLSGLAATLTYNDGEVKEVDLNSFGAYEITVDPANDTIMTALHNQTVITITCNGKEANTNVLTVIAPINAQTPSITSQPKSSKVTAGGSIILAVEAAVTDGGTLIFQWYSNTANSNVGGTAIKGATSATYTPDTNKAGTYYFYVVITNTNNSATVTQTSAATGNVVTVTVDGSGGKLSKEVIIAIAIGGVSFFLISMGIITRIAKKKKSSV